MAPDMNNEVFSAMEIDTIGEIMNISMGSAATAASTLLDNKVLITTPMVEICAFEAFGIGELSPAIAVEIKYVEGISGSNILILRKSDVRVILSQMMQTEIPENFEIDELAESAICELMNQMMGSSATVLSCFLGRTINISTPSTVPIDHIETFKEEFFGPSSHVVTVSFNLTISDIMDSTFMCAMHIDLAKEIISASMNFDTDPEPEPEPAAAPQPAAAPPPQPQYAAPPPQQPQAQPMPPPQPQYAAPQQQPAPAYALPQAYPQQPPPGYYPPPQYGPPPGYPPYGYPQQGEAPVVVKDFNYSDFGGPGSSGREAPTNLDLVMGVPVMVTVELGRTKRKIKDILEFGQGTIVELDKQAGSQVDVIVNGQLIARGDVVVVDDNFSIRITEILKSRDALGVV
jgi:flagellar motor switch protein FliN/FliY